MASVATPSGSSPTPTLWATASKEWVIQPKPKPGRKPKKDTSTTKADDNAEGKGRRVQNRAAQRAFRERKQSQLAELQARVTQYEQGEIERNVALQNISKRLKEENEKLRTENAFLQERISLLERESHERPEAPDKKRQRESSSPTRGATRKRSKTVVEPAFPAFSVSYMPSPPSMVSSPDSNGTSETRFSPLPYETQSAESNGDNHAPAFIGYPPKQASMSNFEPAVFPQFDCGFCNDDTPCVCREIALQQAAADRLVATTSLKIEAIESPSIVGRPVEATIRIESPPPVKPSILENLPAYRPPVPLRRRATGASATVVFPVVPASQQEATCSGDPDNCMACAGDTFGKAFCDAVGKTASVIEPYESFPLDKAADGPTNASSSSHQYPPPEVSSNQGATMPTNQAWKQLKAHPNVEFSDLELLAEVVARRSKCTGPRVVVWPGSLTPERPATPQIQVENNARNTDERPVLLTDPHANYHASGSRTESPPRLVPEEVLLQCRRQRVTEVSTDAVRQALRLLDAKYARS